MVMLGLKRRSGDERRSRAALTPHHRSGRSPARSAPHSRDSSPNARGQSPSSSPRRPSSPGMHRSRDASPTSPRATSPFSSSVGVSSPLSSPLFHRKGRDRSNHPGKEREERWDRSLSPRLTRHSDHLSRSPPLVRRVKSDAPSALVPDGHEPSVGSPRALNLNVSPQPTRRKSAEASSPSGRSPTSVEISPPLFHQHHGGRGISPQTGPRRRSDSAPHAYNAHVVATATPTASGGGGGGGGGAPPLFHQGSSPLRVDASSGLRSPKSPPFRKPRIASTHDED